METNELNSTTSLNNIYDIINYNGTRIRKLKKTVKAIALDNKTYFVPRADKSYGTITDLYIFGCGNYLCFNNDNEEHETLSMNDIQSQESNICCSFDSDTTSESTVMETHVVMTIFRDGDAQPFFQKYVTANEDYEFTSSLDFPIGQYIIIISGATSACPYYKYEEAYSIYRLSVVSAQSSYTGIKEARITSTRNLAGTLLPISFDIEHIHQLNCDENLKGLCIDEDMNVVSFKEICFKMETGKHSTFTYETTYPWMENKQYTLIIGDYKEAKSTLTFNISDKSHCIVNDSQYIEEVHSNIYQMFYNNDKLLRTIYPTSGLSSIKKQAVKLYSIRQHVTELNNEAGKNLLPTKHCLVVSSERPNFTPFAEHAAVAANIYINYIDCFEWIDANELMKENDWENLDNSKQVSIWCNLSVLSNNRTTALKYMKKYLVADNCVTLYDTPHEIERFFKTFPELKPFFDFEYMLEENHPTAIEVTAQFINCVKQTCQYTLSERAISHICHHMALLEQQGNKFANYNNESISFFIQSHVVKQLRKRCYNTDTTFARCNWEYLQEITPDDIDFSVIEQDVNMVDINEILSELNEMVGLDMIKNNLTDLSIQLMFNHKRRELGFPDVPQPCHHMIFSGSPGTGKTTVAKMIGKIFHSLGLLSKGEVISLERKDLVGEYIGHTESIMQKILENAKGNVLFIDEAYSLGDNSPQSKDFGRHVIEALLPILAQEQADLLVIMAGYKEEMNTLMETNTGLKGRFPHIWHFENFNADELLLIACNHLDKMSFRLTDEAKVLLHKSIIKELSICDKYFSNARWIKQQITHSILPRMAKRVMKSPQRNDATFFSTIEVEDIVINSSSDKDSDSRRTPIGFHTAPQGYVA